MARRINDDEREMWVINDECLYLMKLNSKLPMRKFIKAYCKKIDEVIRAILEKSPSDR